MNQNDAEALCELLEIADKTKQVLRVCFDDNEIYDLTGFAIAQDIGEDYPHCTAVDVEPIITSEEKREIFSAEVAMSFSFNNVAEVRDTSTGKLLFIKI